MGNWGGFQRNVTVQRVKTAGTTVVPLGAQSVSIVVNAGTTGVSPTLQGVAVEKGAYNLNAQDTETLNAITVVTSTGDDVTILTIA